jgi:ATP-dependent Clp protease ATP-binding subunit ClpX
VKYGIIPELVGRIPVITALNGLDVDALVKILSEPKNSLTKQYKKLFAFDGVELELTDDALAAIAKLAKEQKTGARGLRGIMESILNELMFETPSDETITKIIINEEVVNKISEPIIERSNNKKKPKRIDSSKVIDAEEVS